MASAFTLVELLTVLAIMGIVLSIGVVSVTRMSRATKLQTAATAVANTLKLAQQYAITHQCVAAVVFAVNRDANATVPGFPTPYASYAVATASLTHADITDKNAPIKYGWGYITRWYKLPEGVLFDYSQGGIANANFGDFDPAEPNNTGTVPSTYTAKSGPKFRNLDFPTDNRTIVGNGEGFAGVIVFLPPGRESSYDNVYLREGFFDLASRMPIYLPAGVVTNVNYVNVLLRKPFGGVKIERKTK